MKRLAAIAVLITAVIVVTEGYQFQDEEPFYKDREILDGEEVGPDSSPGDHFYDKQPIYRDTEIFEDEEEDGQELTPDERDESNMDMNEHRHDALWWGSRRRSKPVVRTTSRGSGSTSGSGKIKDDCLNFHNAKRSLHQSTPLMTYNTALAAGAQRYAKYLADTNKFEHASGNFGENLSSSRSSRVMQIAGAVTRASNGWYNEIQNYNFRSGTSKNGKKIGHFTQMVWDNSVSLGCGVALSKDKKRVVVVARYSPPGNYRNQYTKHVHPRK